MDFHLDHEVRLSEESEFKNLYTWSLQEFSSDGTKIGSDQIPWDWGLYFSASELIYRKSLKIEKVDESAEDAVLSYTLDRPESITAVIRPGICRNGSYLENDIAFSMFGTKREVKDFSLNIFKLESEQDRERCHIWSCVSYTTDFDFRYETMPDTIEINVWVDAEKFYEICEKLSRGEIDIFQVRLKGASGFYSEWTPSVTTNRVKVLAPGKEQSIVLPDGAEISPPRVGDVKEFELTYAKRKRLNINQDMETASTSKQFNSDTVGAYAEQVGTEQKVEQNLSSLIQSRLLANERAIERLGTPLWAAVILLIAILILK